MKKKTNLLDKHKTRPCQKLNLSNNNLCSITVLIVMLGFFFKIVLILLKLTLLFLFALPPLLQLFSLSIELRISL